MILHTPGGHVLAAEQIAKALSERKAPVTVFVPHYAMSGGTIIALAADEIVMDANAVLGPVDPQIGDMPAASIVRMVEIKGPPNVSDQMLVLADVAQKARIQVAYFVSQSPPAQALPAEEGDRDRDDPLRGAVDPRLPHPGRECRKQLGLPVSTDMPRTVYDLMDLYPQGAKGRPSVLYVPSSEATKSLPTPRTLPWPRAVRDGAGAGNLDGTRTSIST